jgi:hypothetical protein
MPHLPPAHHETSKDDSPSETKVKEKQNETIPDLNSNLVKSMTHHNQTKELTTWFLRQALIDLIAEIINTNIATLSVRAWAMYFDESACEDECDIGILLLSPRGWG